MRGAREHAVVEPVEQRDRLLAGGARMVDVADRGRHPRVGDERPADQLPVARQPRGFERRVGRLGGLEQPPAGLERVREPDLHRHHELALAAGAATGRSRGAGGGSSRRSARRSTRRSRGSTARRGGSRADRRRARRAARRSPRARRRPRRRCRGCTRRSTAARWRAPPGRGRSSARAVSTARTAHARIASKSLSYSASAASSTCRAAAAALCWSASASSAASSRAWAASWRPSRFSHAAQAAIRRTRRSASSTRSSASTSVSSARSSRPVAASAPRQRHEQAEAAERVVGGAGAEQSQRGVEPARRDRGSAGGGLVAGLLEHRRGGVVADARGVLDVVRARRERAGPRRRAPRRRGRVPAAATPRPPPS